MTSTTRAPAPASAPVLDGGDGPALKAAFDAHGYVVVDGLWTAAQIQEIEDFFEEYKRGEHLFDGAHTFADIDMTQRQVRAMHPHRESRRALQWMTNPPVAEVLALLLGQPALGVQTMYYFKPPGARGQGMHQDNFYLLARPATCIAAWTAIDDAEIDNGCLYVVPGSHRGDILCPEGEQATRWLGYGDSPITKFPREARPAPVPVRRGQTMFFGGNLIHGSGPNRTSDRSRRTFIGHYVDAATDVLAKYYFPIIDMHGETVAGVAPHEGGGACGDGWTGAVH